MFRSATLQLDNRFVVVPLLINLFRVPKNLNAEPPQMPTTLSLSSNPEGPYTLPMELGPQKTIPVLVLVLGPNSIMVVYVGPSG